MADSVTDHPESMANLLGDWATGHLTTASTGRREDSQLISSVFDISLPTSCPTSQRPSPCDQSACLSIDSVP